MSPQNDFIVQSIRSDNLRVGISFNFYLILFLSLTKMPVNTTSGSKLDPSWYGMKIWRILRECQRKNTTSFRPQEF
jgi:hypothetical protein